MLITCTVGAYVQRQLGDEEEVKDTSKNGTICRGGLQADAFFPLLAGKGKQKKSIKQIRGELFSLSHGSLHQKALTHYAFIRSDLDEIDAFRQMLQRQGQLLLSFL